MKLLENKIKIPEDAEDMYLCYLGEDGYQAQRTKIFKKLSSYPQFVCKNCGRLAHDKKNLCCPANLKGT